MQRILGVSDLPGLEGFYAAQSAYIDNGQPDLWAKTFAADGRFESTTYEREIVGHDDLVEFAQGVYRAQGSGQQRHWCGQFMAVKIADDTYEVRFNVLIIAIAPSAETRIARSVAVTDIVMQTPQGWCVATRRAVTDPPTNTTRP